MFSVQSAIMLFWAGRAYRPLGNNSVFGGVNLHPSVAHSGIIVSWAGRLTAHSGIIVFWGRSVFRPLGNNSVLGGEGFRPTRE